MQHKSQLVLALLVFASGCGLYAKPQPPADVAIDGRVTYGNRPASGLWLRFVPTDAPAKEVQADSSGRFSVRIASAEKTTIEFRTLKNLPVGSASVASLKNGTAMSIELPDTTVSLNLRGPIGKTPAQLQFYQIYPDGHLAQHPQLAGIVTPQEFSSTLNGLRPGKYRIVADAPAELVSKAPADVEIRVGTQASASIEIVQASRRLMTQAGKARSAQIRVFAGQKTFEGNPVQLARISPGTPVVVTSIGFLPKCVVVSDLPSTTVTLEPEQRSVTKLVIGPEKAWPAGALAGPADACFIDAAQYPAKSTPSSSTSAIDIEGLASSRYSYMPFDNARLIDLVSGQKPINVDMPIGCNECRSTYPAKIVIR